MQDNAEYTVLKSARFERKFVVENKDLGFVEHLVKFNPGAFRSIHKKRRVNNVYFDSPNMNNYYDNHFGKSERVKIRIRWYGDTFKDIKKPILEYKLKFGAAGKKQSYPLSSFNVESMQSKNDWTRLFEESNLPEKVINDLKSSIPTLLNTYERKYFQSFDSDFRFTTDFNMKFYNIKSNNNRFIEKTDEKNTIVLELKYDMENDKKVKKISAALPFRLGKFSKYVRGIELFHPHLAV